MSYATTVEAEKQTNIPPKINRRKGSEMITVLLILAIVLVSAAGIGLTGWCFGQGFFFWVFVGQDVARSFVYAIGLLIGLLIEQD